MFRRRIPEAIIAHKNATLFDYAPQNPNMICTLTMRHLDTILANTFPSDLIYIPRSPLEFILPVVRITNIKGEKKNQRLNKLRKDISRQLIRLNLQRNGEKIILSDSIRLRDTRVLKKELTRLNTIKTLKTDHQHLLKKYTKNTVFLEKVGARKQSSNILNISGNIDVYGLKLASLGVDFKSGTIFDSNDEGSVRVHRFKQTMSTLWAGVSFKLSQCVELGSGGHTQCSATKTKYKKFANHKQLAQYLSAKQSTLLTKQQQKALNAKSTTVRLLAQYGENIDGEKVHRQYQSLLHQSKKNYKQGVTHSYTTSLGLNANAKLTFNSRDTWNAQASTKISKTYEKTVETVTDDLANHSMPIDNFRAVATFLNGWLPSINKPTEWIAFIRQLEKDIFDYTEVVKHHDYLKSLHSGSNGSRREKRRLEVKYGNVGRHQQLQFFYLTYAWLKATVKVMQQTSSDTSFPFNTQADLIYRALQQIDFDYSATRLENLTKIRQKVHEKKRDINSSVTVQVGPITLTIERLERHFSHPSRVRSGDYHDVNITLAANASLAQLLQLTGLKQQLYEVLVSHQLESFLDIDTLIQANIGGFIAIQRRSFRPRNINLAFEGRLQPQFTRYYLGEEMIAGTGISSPLATGLCIDTNLSYQQRQRQVMAEVINPDDLTYSLVRFNKLYKDANKNLSNINNPWQQFVLSHKESYQAMFLAFAEQQGAVTHQARALLNQVEEQGQSPITETAFFRTMQAYRDARKCNEMNQSDLLFNQALLAFNQLLISQFDKTEALHQATWIKKPFKADRSQALDTKSKIINKFKLRDRVNAKILMG